MNLGDPIACLLSEKKTKRQSRAKYEMRGHRKSDPVVVPMKRVTIVEGRARQEGVSKSGK